MTVTGPEPGQAPILRPILILGGSGFIGTRLTALLKKQGIPVRIGDIRASEAFPGIWIHCDVRHCETFSEEAQGVDVIVNLAAEHRDDVRPLSRYRETNVKGASEVCLVARKHGIRKIVFTSSVAVYGFHPYPVDENGPFDPFNAYGRTKLEAEGVYRAWAAEDPSRTLVVIRPAVVFGEGNRETCITSCARSHRADLLMVGLGNNVKSMAYVDNVAAFVNSHPFVGTGRAHLQLHR